jgi:hypothetical protein
MGQLKSASLIVMAIVYRASCGWISPSLGKKGYRNPQPGKKFTSVGNSKRNFVPFLVAQRKWLQRAYLITSVRKQQAPATFKCMQHASRRRYVGSRPCEWRHDNPGVPRRAHSIQQRACPFSADEIWMDSGAAPAQQERISLAIHLLQWPVSVILDNGG